MPEYYERQSRKGVPEISVKRMNIGDQNINRAFVSEKAEVVRVQRGFAVSKMMVARNDISLSRKELAELLVGLKAAEESEE